MGKDYPYASHLFALNHFLAHYQESCCSRDKGPFCGANVLTVHLSSFLYVGRFFLRFSCSPYIIVWDLCAMKLVKCFGLGQNHE